MCLFLNFEQGVKDKANKEIASQQTYVLSTWSCVKQDNEKKRPSKFKQVVLVLLMQKVLLKTASNILPWISGPILECVLE